MSGIRGKNTKPEIAVRKLLFARGFRYRLHYKRLPGTPDMVFPKHRVAVFVNGCFWPAHGCRQSKMPATNTEFWAAKLGRNNKNDQRNEQALLALGWRVAVIWECSIRSRSDKELQRLANKLDHWILGRKARIVVPRTP